IVEEMFEKWEIYITSNYITLRKNGFSGDFNFVVLEKIIAKTHALKWHEKIILEIYKTLKRFSLSEEKGFGLDSSFVTLERVPLNIPTTKDVAIKRLQ